MLIKVCGLRAAYGAVEALHGVDIEADRGEVLSIIGANGAGKTTLLKTIAGVVKATSGEILYEDKKITNERSDRIVRMGIALVPEGRRVFPDLTVRDNLRLGAYTLRNRKLKKDLLDLVLQTFPKLRERLWQHAGTLSGGEQQMLAVGRAIMANPRLLLLDEPSMGLSPLMTQEIFSLIRKINGEKGISMILVEQNAYMALEFSHRTYVLENGAIVMSGDSCKVKSDPAVLAAYFGG
jgi:branched-chain amino acid transport system ATP-binding protein